MFIIVHTIALSFVPSIFLSCSYSALPPQDRGSYFGSGGDLDTDDDASGMDDVSCMPRYAGGGTQADALLPEALSALRAAVETEAKKRGKAVSELLLRSAHVARLMHGGRTTSCKSAKDRTSMFQTLEVVRLVDPTRGSVLFTPQGVRKAAPMRTLSRMKDAEASGGRKNSRSMDSAGGGGFTHLTNEDGASGRHNSNDVQNGPAAADERAVLNALRGVEGVRLRNAELNVGRLKYAFNKLQLEALPQELRPPANTASGGKS